MLTPYKITTMEHNKTLGVVRAAKETCCTCSRPDQLAVIQPNQRMELKWQDSTRGRLSRVVGEFTSSLDLLELTSLSVVLRDLEMSGYLKRRRTCRKN